MSIMAMTIMIVIVLPAATDTYFLLPAMRSAAAR